MAVKYRRRYSLEKATCLFEDCSFKMPKRRPNFPGQRYSKMMYIKLTIDNKSFQIDNEGIIG